MQKKKLQDLTIINNGKLNTAQLIQKYFLYNRNAKFKTQAELASALNDYFNQSRTQSSVSKALKSISDIEYVYPSEHSNRMHSIMITRFDGYYCRYTKSSQTKDICEALFELDPFIEYKVYAFTENIFALKIKPKKIDEVIKIFKRSYISDFLFDLIPQNDKLYFLFTPQKATDNYKRLIEEFKEIPQIVEKQMIEFKLYRLKY